MKLFQELMKVFFLNCRPKSSIHQSIVLQHRALAQEGPLQLEYQHAYSQHAYSQHAYSQLARI